MRKILGILASVLILSTAPVSAREIDFSGYSVEELIEIRDKVDAALYEKDGLVIAQVGTYTVGRDIAAGSYVLKPFPVDELGLGVLHYKVYKYEGAKEEYEKARNAYTTAYANAEAVEEKGEAPVWPEKVNESDYLAASGEIDSEDGDSGRISVTDGQIIEFSTSWGPVVIAVEKAGGLFMN